MNRITTVISAGVLVASALALTATSASARIVCNEDGDCWHSRTVYEYPSEVHLRVHPDDWHWAEGESHAWREHEGRGYWRNHAWTDF